MGARYAATGLQTPVGAGAKTVLEMLAAATVRPRLYDLMWGSSGTPADNSMVEDVIRITASGTGTAVVAEALDPADVAALTLYEEDHTVEPTTTGIALIEIPRNLRASYRWVAAPGSEIVVAAVAGEGLAIRTLSSAYTGQSEVTAMHEE